MGKVAFLFSGQGAQQVGMCSDIYEKYVDAKTIFDAADAYDAGLKELCFFGPKEKMDQTIYTQPLLYVVEMAIYNVLLQNNIIPDVLAGFSLGELAALSVAGCYDFLTGLEIVKNRAECMEKATQAHDASMMAILKISKEELLEILHEVDDVYPANYNSSQQIVVSGTLNGLRNLEEKVKLKKGRCIPLAVSGGFHSPFMDEGSLLFKNVLDTYQLENPNIPVYGNSTAQIYDKDIKESMVKQINHPVYWEDTVRNMERDGVDTFVEIGAGKVLVGLVKKIAPTASVYSATTAEGLQEVMEKLR